MNDRFDSLMHKLLLGSALLALLPAGAGAQQAAPFAAEAAQTGEEVRRYAVEMIVFEYGAGAGGTKEAFLPDEPEVETLADTFGDDAARMTGPGDELQAGADSTMPGEEVDELAVELQLPVREEELTEFVTYEHIGLEVLPPSEYQLDDVYERLERLDAYRPLMRAAWVQPTLPAEATRPIKLRILGNPPLRLDGTVTLYLNRFLHLVMNLSLEEKAPFRGGSEFRRDGAFGDNRVRSPFSFGSGNAVTASIFYRIEEDRIVRNGELRYYDHPKFGVIARITRVEEEERPAVGDDTGDLLPGS